MINPFEPYSGMRQASQQCDAGLCAGAGMVRMIVTGSTRHWFEATAPQGRVIAIQQ